MGTTESTATAEPLKDWFNADRYRVIADDLAAACPQFDRDVFLHSVLDRLEARSLMERLRQTAIAADAALPGSYRTKLQILERVAAAQPPGFIGIWLSEFAGRFGVDEPDRALAALRHFTRYGSAEFAIRPYLAKAPTPTLATMLAWTTDANEHVRRLASEGSRPRLPWGQRLDFLVQDPRPTRPILEALKDDPSLYVRKSVANHLNDIAKDHPDYVIELVSTWDRRSPATAFIVKQGLRTLVKRAHPAALALLGAGAAPQLVVDRFAAVPARLRLGEHLTLQLELRSTARAPQTLIIDYVIHYVKANGRTAAKVFKWRQLDLAVGAVFTVTKRQMIQDFTTRKHHPGEHQVALQINGRIMAETAFHLRR